MKKKWHNFHLPESSHSYTKSIFKMNKCLCKRECNMCFFFFNNIISESLNDCDKLGYKTISVYFFLLEWRVRTQWTFRTFFLFFMQPVRSVKYILKLWDERFLWHNFMLNDIKLLWYSKCTKYPFNMKEIYNDWLL